MRYTRIYPVICTDMDNNYRLTPAAVLLYFQESFARYMSCLRMAAFDLINERKMWVITEMSADMMPIDVFWGDDIEVQLWISEITTLRVYADYIICKVGSGEVIASGTSCWCLMNADTRGLETTEGVMERITIVPCAGGHKKMRIPKGGTMLRQIEHIVNQIDLDFNGHVNNRSYISIAMLTVPAEFITKYRTTHFAIHWLHESYLNETLQCTLYEVSEQAYVHRITRGDGSIAAEIYSTWQAYDHIADVPKLAKRESLSL